MGRPERYSLRESAFARYTLVSFCSFCVRVRLEARLTLRLDAACRSQMTVEVSYDGGPWENAAALTVEGPRRNCDLHLVPRRCASLRLRLWGYGQITLRSLAKTFSAAKGNWMELEG